MRFHRLCVLSTLVWVLVGAGCLTTKTRSDSDTADEDEFVSSGERQPDVEIKRDTTKFSDRRKVPKPTRAEFEEFRRIWELFRKNDTRWPLERDRFKRKSEGAAYLLSGHLLHYYMQVNKVRQRAGRQVVRAKNEIVAVGEPCIPPLIDMMILDRIPLKKGQYFLVDDITRQDCVDMLERMGETSVPYLLDVLKRKDVGVKGRHMTALALGGTKAREAYEPLVRLLQKDPAWQVRFSAAIGLGALGDRRAIRPLYAAAQSDPDKSVRKRALEVRRKLLISR